MSRRLKDRVAVVLGAGSSGPGWGNGKAAAVLFAREGARVFAVDLRHRAAEETREIVAAEGGDATSFTADVSKAQDIKSLVDACIKASAGSTFCSTQSILDLAVTGRLEHSGATVHRLYRPSTDRQPAPGAIGPVGPGANSAL